jgi:hypothetical protein
LDLLRLLVCYVEFLVKGPSVLLILIDQLLLLQLKKLYLLGSALNFLIYE